MSWLFEKNIRASARNGAIVVRRALGDWQVVVGGCGQTTPYTHAMWVDAFFRIGRAERAAAREALMLGLGGGGEVRTIHDHFPNTRLTAVEYDPAMIALTKEIKLYRPYSLPEIIGGDAKEVVPALPQQYDFVMLDLFSGPEPSPLATDAEFLEALRAHVSRGGLLVANVYKRAQYLDAIAAHFDERSRWTFKSNTLGLFANTKR